MDRNNRDSAAECPFGHCTMVLLTGFGLVVIPNVDRFFIELDSRSCFQKDACMSSTSALVSSQKNACMSSTRHRPQRKILSVAAEEA
jgi:hypothetical protein